MRLCRPSEVVLNLLPEGPLGTFSKEDGEVVIDAQGRRMRSRCCDSGRTPLLQFRARQPHHLPTGADAQGGHDHGHRLIGRRGALDLHDSRDDSAPEAAALQLPPRSVLQFLITLELLSIERAVLQGLYDRLTHAAPRSIDGLIGLKKDVMDGLEEYYGSTLASTRFNDVVAEQGEDVLGIVDLFEAVTDRLDMVSFTLTTTYQQRMTMLQFWLTVVFGATEIGFIAATIATWYYASGLGAVLAWTVGAAAVSGGVLVALLRHRTQD